MIDSESERNKKLADATAHLPPFKDDDEIWVWSEEEIKMLRLACAKRFGETLRTESLFCIAATGIRIFNSRTNPRPREGDVERVARAICRAETQRTDDEIGLGGEKAIAELVERNWNCYLQEARAAIGSLSPPEPAPKNPEDSYNIECKEIPALGVSHEILREWFPDSSARANAVRMIQLLQLNAVKKMKAKAEPAEKKGVDEALLLRKMGQASHAIDVSSGLRASHADFAKAQFAVVKPYLTQLPADLPLSGWQPIETAPKDGTVILGDYSLDGSGDDLHTVMYMKDWHGDGMGQWLSSICTGKWNAPKRWMPLPPPADLPAKDERYKRGFDDGFDAAKTDLPEPEVVKGLVEALKYCREMAINGMASHRDCIAGAVTEALASLPIKYRGGV